MIGKRMILRYTIIIYCSQLKRFRTPRARTRLSGWKGQGALRLCSRDSHRPRSWLERYSRHRYRLLAWLGIAAVTREAGTALTPEDRWEATVPAARAFPAEAAG